MPHIITELTLFQMQVKVLRPQTAFGDEANFSHAPKAHNAVNVIAVSCELGVTVVDPVVFLVTPINEAVISLPTVRIDGAGRDLSSLQSPALGQF